MFGLVSTFRKYQKVKALNHADEAHNQVIVRSKDISQEAASKGLSILVWIQGLMTKW